MNLPLKPVGGVCGEAGAVSIGVLGAASANFQSHWINAEDAMAASIIRLECQKDELNAEVALLREQARILQAERDEARLQYRSTHALAEALAKTQVELKAERAIMKMERDDARQALQCHLDAFRGTGNANVRLQHELNDCRRLIAELEARK